MEALLARQPIFNALGAVVGYELLRREGAMLDIGLPAFVGASRAWISIPERALVADDWTVLDRANCVIEVLGSVPATDETRAALERLVKAGYEVALDDFIDHPGFESFLKLARVVKVDVSGKDPRSLQAAVKRYKRRGLTVLAERIETKQVHDACRAAGFDLFKGHHFARPEIVEGRRTSPQVAVLADAMNRLTDEDMPPSDLEDLFAADASLTFRLLRIANSTANGRSGADSVRHAIALVGRDALRRWIAVLLAACGPRQRGDEQERFRTALERARFAELIAEHLDRRRGPSAFLAGLLSMLDVVLGVPLDDIMAMLTVTDDVKAALMDRIGPLAGPLLLAESLEQGRWESAATQVDLLGVPRELIQPTMLEAARWARGMRTAV